jgi:hypothetical protein
VQPAKNINARKMFSKCFFMIGVSEVRMGYATKDNKPRSTY